jgi:hypothetical protein
MITSLPNFNTIFSYNIGKKVKENHQNLLPFKEIKVQQTKIEGKIFWVQKSLLSKMFSPFLSLKFNRPFMNSYNFKTSFWERN